MQMAYTIKGFLFAIFLDLNSILYIFLVSLIQWIPNPIMELLEDTHLQAAFKGGSSVIIGLLLIIGRCYDVIGKHKKHKAEIATKSYFDAYIMAGNTLKDTHHYESAIISYTKALDINFDNDLAKAKINEVKHLLELNK